MIPDGHIDDWISYWKPPRQYFRLAVRGRISYRGHWQSLHTRSHESCV